jgi:hypothetical protein
MLQVLIPFHSEQSKNFERQINISKKSKVYACLNQPIEAWTSSEVVSHKTKTNYQSLTISQKKGEL